jgi:sigma-54 dependent transcriptional regulator, acetoin dehydrogenase operon transcriptional activator AcoR
MSSAKMGWNQFVAHLRLSPPSLPLRLCIRESWDRCAGNGVSRAMDHQIRLRRVSDLELEDRLQKSRDLIRAATPVIAAFSSSRKAIQHVLYLTDQDGIVLLSRGNHKLMLMYGLCPGFDWSEKTMGTNGAGTALATDSAVAVIGPDHYQLPFQEATCLAAPIHSSTGDLIGAVDFSTHVKDVAVSHLADIVALAKAIETALPTLQSQSKP